MEGAGYRQDPLAHGVPADVRARKAARVEEMAGRDASVAGGRDSEAASRLDQYIIYEDRKGDEQLWREWSGRRWFKELYGRETKHARFFARPVQARAGS